MIVDSSAVLTILFREPGFEVFLKAIVDSRFCTISAANLVEVSIIIESRGGDSAIRQWDAFFRSSGISVASFTEEQALIARQGFSDYGKGRHPAGLNFGDCFSYALAKSLGEPLLFKGDDFRHTDIQPALP